MSNPFLPRPAVILDIIDENPQIKTFVTSFRDEMFNRCFTYEPGQFMMVSLAHHGEAPISISSTPTRPGTLHLSVRRAGRLTGAMFDLAVGDVIGLRGPYGRPFPLDIIGRDLLFVAGGIGLAPLRSVIHFCIDKGGEQGKKIILYGSRNPDEIAFTADIAAWQEKTGVDVRLTVDQGAPGWKGTVGLVTHLLDTLALSPEQTTALVCGPEVMIHATLERLTRLGLSDDNIWTTMERHMKCGIGTCGHCHMNGALICREGPVYNVSGLKELQILQDSP